MEKRKGREEMREKGKGSWWEDIIKVEIERKGREQVKKEGEEVGEKKTVKRREAEKKKEKESKGEGEGGKISKQINVYKDTAVGKNINYQIGI